MDEKQTADNHKNLLSNMKILYVEDETAAREELFKYLKRRVGKIYAAQDGVQGLAMYQEFVPDIVIADLYMPNMDGIDMVREIRKIGKDCHVIIASAVNDVEVILRSVDVGINKYLIKPIDPAELLDALTEVAEKIMQKKRAETPIEGEYKKKLEDDIKREFSAFLKTYTGKGPRDVVVFIHDDLIEITAFDALTVMEKNMIDHHKNVVVIEQNRKLFYSIQEQTIGNILHNILQKSVVMKQVEINAEKATNKLIFQVL